MPYMLMNAITRRIRRVAIGSALGMVAATTVAVANPFHDPNFDEADLAAEKAQILLTAAACGAPGAKSTVECEKHVKTAQDLLKRVREEIDGAATAADGGA